MTAWFNHELLVRARTELGLTQEEVARGAGVDVRTYRRYESGEVNQSGGFGVRTPSRRRLLDSLCRELGLAEEELVRAGSNGASNGSASSGDKSQPGVAHAATPQLSVESARVFLSYSHDSPMHRSAVDELARLLATWGARVAVDTALQRPPEGWAQWSMSQFAEADIILMICTTEYRRRVELCEVPEQGPGATWEGPLLSDLVYDGNNAFGRIGVVLLEGATVDAIPAPFRVAPRFRVPADAEDLRVWLGQPLRRRRLLELVVAESDVDAVDDEPSLYVNRGERDLAAYLRDLEALRDLDPREDESEARRRLEERINAVRRQLRSGAHLNPGETLDGGTYSLVRRLGTGGFGTVWLASDAKVKRAVAIKVLKPEHQDDRTRRARFFRGARVMADLNHPGIVRVFDAGRIEAGHHYFVMEFVKGGDLNDWVKSQKPELQATLRIVASISEALRAAHQRGIVHRDVKPANILVGVDGVPKLTDFDLVYAPDTEGDTQAEPMGTYLYASPEVLADPSAVDPRADIYSLGMTLLFCLLGGNLTITSKHEIPSVLERVELPDALKRLVLRATASDPAGRPETMNAFSAELAAIEQVLQPRPSLAAEGPSPYPFLRSLSGGQRLLMVRTGLCVGRAPGNDLRLERRQVSAQHAAIFWTGRNWMVRDLGSRNGTFVDQRRIPPGEQYPLKEGSVLAFGQMLEAWELASAQSPPETAAVNATSGEVTLPEDGLLTLSDPEGDALVFLGSEGWVCEREEGVRPIVDGEELCLGSSRWTVRINARTGPVTGAIAPPSELSLAGLELVFQISRDEEHVQVSARANGRTIDLGARSHNYLLVTLARRRIQNAQAGLPDTSCGWIYQEDLAHDPSMALPQLNIDVFRIRKQFAAVGVVDAASIIERRPRTRQLRIGTSRLTIVSV